VQLAFKLYIGVTVSVVVIAIPGLNSQSWDPGLRNV